MKTILAILISISATAQCDTVYTVPIDTFYYTDQDLGFDLKLWFADSQFYVQPVLWKIEKPYTPPEKVYVKVEVIHDWVYPVILLSLCIGVALGMWAKRFNK